MDWGNLVVEARKRGAQAAELLKDASFEFSCDVRDAAKTGFGVPKLVSTAASLGVATVAAGGAASVAFDFTGKIWGKKECATCNGWEGLRCQICRGAGKVQYNVNESSLSEAERLNSQSIAVAAMEGRAAIEYLAAKSDLPFPYIDCPLCDGTGVMKCTACHGNAWVPKFTIAKAMNAPWLAWDAYRKIDPPSEPADGITIDPTMTEYEMFGKHEVQDGIQHDDEINQATMGKFKDAREYDIVRAMVARRDPGWETLQENVASEVSNTRSGSLLVTQEGGIDVICSRILGCSYSWMHVVTAFPCEGQGCRLTVALLIKDPIRAAQDPVIVSDPTYYKAKMKILSKVKDLPVPPRPADWLGMERPLSKSDWTEEDLKDPRKRSEMKILLDGQEKFFNKLLDSTWENHWQVQKFEEVKKGMMESYLQEEDAPEPVKPEAKQKDSGTAPRSSSASNVKQPKAVAGKKVDAKKRLDDDKKKRERQERSERMARQAAEREVALSKAKAARGSTEGQ